MREASYSFVNLLSWARATVERTDRPYQPGSSGRAGLLPALRPGELRDSVEAALQHLRTALLGFPVPVELRLPRRGRSGRREIRQRASAGR